MSSLVSKLLRSIQIYFPVTQDYKFQFKRWLRRILQRTHEKDFDALTILPLRENEREKLLFLDIGANRGEVVQTILMKKPTAHVIAFEPNDLIIHKLQRIYKDDARVEIRHMALGSREGMVDLLVPVYEGFMFDALATLKEEGFYPWLNENIYRFKKDKLVVRKLPCQVKRLDDLNLRPDFIKIDVRGTEYDVLLGAEKTLRESRPILMIEAPGEHEFDFLVRLGYQSFIYSDAKLVAGASGGVHVFFIPGLSAQ